MPETINAGLEELRTAHRQLLAAHDVWMKELRKTSAKLGQDDLLSVTRHLNETFKRFMSASEAVRLEAQWLPHFDAGDSRRADLATTGASFLALSTSIGVLGRGGSRISDVEHELLRAAAAGVYKYLVNDIK